MPATSYRTDAHDDDAFDERGVLRDGKTARYRVTLMDGARPTMDAAAGQRFLDTLDQAFADESYRRVNAARARAWDAVAAVEEEPDETALSAALAKAEATFGEVTGREVARKVLLAASKAAKATWLAAVETALAAFENPTTVEKVGDAATRADAAYDAMCRENARLSNGVYSAPAYRAPVVTDADLSDAQTRAEAARAAMIHRMRNAWSDPA